MAPSAKGRAHYIPPEIKDALAVGVIEVHSFKIPVYKYTLINKMNWIIGGAAHKGKFKEWVVGYNWHFRFIRA